MRYILQKLDRPSKRDCYMSHGSDVVFWWQCSETTHLVIVNFLWKVGTGAYKHEFTICLALDMCVMLDAAHNSSFMLAIVVSLACQFG